jgi:sugar phosphate isomerase/epimerase
VIEHARACSDAGLRISLHPYTERTLHNPAFFEPGEDNPCRTMHERFLSLAERVADLQQAETVVNIHSAADTAVPRTQLLDRSVQFFEWARGWCARRAVRVVAELQIAPNPDEDVQRIGDNYAELLALLRRSGVDACWDFGHAVMNARRFGRPVDPPEELLPRVAHVHCHDVDDDDHQPLIFGNVPVARFLTQLTANGFDGTVILEVPPDRFLANGGLETLVRSTRLLERLCAPFTDR